MPNLKRAYVQNGGFGSQKNNFFLEKNKNDDEMGGRPRKPTAVKELQGTLQKCRRNPNEPKPAGELKNALPPAYLTDTARDIWIYALENAPEGLLTSLDFAVFTQWVVCFDAFITISAALKEGGTVQTDGQGVKRVNDLLHQLLKTTAILRGLENELGFTPASRSKITTVKADSVERNAFSDFG